MLSIELGDARNDDTITLDGKDGVRRSSASTSRAGSSTAAVLDASPSFARFDQTSDFLLVLQNLQVPINGFPPGGLLSYELTKDSGISDVRRIRVIYDGSNLARVEVQFTNGDFKYYKFELQFLNFIS